MPNIEARGLRFHYQSLGTSGDTVIFIHGLVMDNLASWYFTLGPALSEEHRVLLYDLRGHGRSARPERGYAGEDHVADLVAILDALAVEGPVTLVGNSFGAYIATAFTLRHPERVARLVLVDGHLAGSGWGATMASTLSLQGETRDQKIAEHFSRWLGRHSTRKRNRLAENARALVENTSLVEDLRNTEEITDSDLASIQCPVLCLYGSESDILPQAERMADFAPHSELRVYQGCSHSVIWENTDRLCADISQWLAPHSLDFAS